jgi:hypothetical protein
MLLATLAAAHVEHHSATDVAVHWLLLLFLGVLLFNVVASAVTILRNREPSDSAD